MENIQRIIVEMDNESPFEYILVKQGEANSRIVEVELIENSVPYIIPTGIKAMVKFRKPDGKKVLNDCTYDGNIVTVTYTEQMLAAYGTGKGEIMLVEGEEIIKSATFYTKIVKTVYKENGLISDDELVSLAGTLIEVNQTLDKIDSAVTGAETAVEEAEQALQKAEEMRESCETATEKANKAAEDCTTATADMQEKCNEAVENANTATTKVETATEKANKAVQDCNTAIQNATAATEEANKAAEQCNDIIDGLTPRIGEDGNWYVGKEDTGVKANGGITVYDGFDSESTINAASARTVKDLKEGLDNHTHTKSEITDFPTAMKNPNALTLKLNGTSQGAYDGSTAKEVNITPSGIGAAANSHTHNYAGSTSAGGAATSAVKLQTARKIKIGNQSNTFDGTKDIVFDEASMGFLKITHLNGVSSGATHGAAFAQIKCKGALYNYSGSNRVTPTDFFMIVNQMYGSMGGYYISSSQITIGTSTYIGGSGGVVYLEANIVDNDLTITLRSMTTVPVIVIYDAANVKVTQL